MDNQRSATMEDPEIIRLNLRHYHELLKRHCATDVRVQVMQLLAEAQAQLHLAETQAQDPGVSPQEQ
jgi:hypothetical protein